MPISGQDITDSIARTLDIKPIQAEKAKIICGLDETRAKGIIKNILADIIEELVLNSLPRGISQLQSRSQK